jgi:alpha-ribazole phosphatase/probable phosphoglycerate mutase
LLRLLLVRHGSTDWNHQGRMQGQTDVPLSDMGLLQAQRVAARLAREEIEAVWSSDMLRARITAEMIAKPHGLVVITSPLLREQHLGDWEGLTQDEIVARGDGERIAAYRRDAVANPPPGAERHEQMWERMMRALTEIRSTHPEGTVVVTGHGGSLRVFLADALGMPLSHLRHIWLDNASLSEIRYGETRPCVHLLNDTCHLHAEDETTYSP